MLSTCISPVSIWLIGNVVPMPSPSDAMTDEPDGELLVVVLVVLEVGVLPVGEIVVDMLGLCLLERRIAPALRRT
ncbi:hypothetical protein [Paraburkholderia sp. RL17-337-BIB-A]|uniref:hypothetical protein n=1 Tax=Paraburkholderia sp. RL17-337-BIB-A TaxID=3031636 RepID=UPI0038B92870